MFKVVTDLSAPGPARASLANNPTAYRPRKYKRTLLRLVVTGLLVGLLWRLNLNWVQIARDLSQANLIAVLGSAGLIFPIIFLKAWRWKLILSNYQIRLSLKEAISLYGLGLSAGSVTPGQAGDFVKALALQEKGLSLSKSLVSTILDRLFDVFVLAILAFWGLLQLGSTFYGQLPLLFLFLILTGLGILILAIPFFFPFSFNRLLGKVLTHKFKSGKAGERSEAVQENQIFQTQHLSLKSIAYSFYLTLATAGLAVARTWLLALALGANLPLLTALEVSSLATIAGLVPITISGIGTRDVALVGVMAQLGYSNDLAISLSTLLLVVNLFNFLAGNIMWFIFKSLNKSSCRYGNPE